MKHHPTVSNYHLEMFFNASFMVVKLYLESQYGGRRLYLATLHFIVHTIETVSRQCQEQAPRVSPSNK